MVVDKIKKEFNFSENCQKTPEIKTFERFCTILVNKISYTDTSCTSSEKEKS